MRYFTLVLLALLCTDVRAQVGVNNPVPEQALDVNGKVKITDDAATPSPGTLRFDAANDDFEGYTSTGWKSFVNVEAGVVPSNAEFFYGYVALVNRGTTRNFILRDWANTRSFSVVPAGKLLIVTALFARPNSLTVGDRFDFTVGPGSETGSFPDVPTSLLFSVDPFNVKPILSEATPLFMVRAGQVLRFNNESTSEVRLAHASIRGYLIDAPE